MPNKNVHPLSRRDFTAASLSALTMLGTGCGTHPASAPAASASTNRLEFTRMCVHWQEYVRPGYLDFLRDTRPEVVQVGFYGADFYTLAHMPDTAERTLRSTHAFARRLVPGRHARRTPQTQCRIFREPQSGRKETRRQGDRPLHVVKYLLGDKTETGPSSRRFLQDLNNLWDEKELGPKPVADPLDLLQKNRDG